MRLYRLYRSTKTRVNPTAKMPNLNFCLLEVVSHWREPQLQVDEKYLSLFYLRQNICKSWFLNTYFNPQNLLIKHIHSPKPSNKTDLKRQLSCLVAKGLKCSELIVPLKSARPSADKLCRSVDVGECGIPCRQVIARLWRVSRHYGGLGR